MSSATEPLPRSATRAGKRGRAPGMAPGAEARRVRARVFLLGLALAAGAFALRGGEEPKVGDSYASALVASLATRGLVVNPASVHFLTSPGRMVDISGAYFLARDLRRSSWREADGLTDLYFARVRTTPPAAVLDTWGVTNVTRSPSANETQLLRVGDRHLAYGLEVDGRHKALVVLSTAGEEPSLTETWPFYARVQNAITNLQETGRVSGFGARRYALSPPAQEVALAGSALAGRPLLRASLDGEVVLIDPEKVAAVAGGHRVSPQLSAKGRPGKLTWVVDTVRNLSFVGPEPIEWLEHTVFGLRDRADRWLDGVFTTDTEAEVAAALGARAVEDSEGAEPPGGAQAPDQTAVVPLGEGREVGPPDWPPPPLQPLLKSSVRGEGRWLPIGDDPFLLENPGAPSAFVQTFIRVDPERRFTRVYITAWDPRQVQLHLAMGTREPEDESGQTGTGRVAADPALIGRLVGGFNGGFQALHGEFGMMADGHIYLPPKAYAATVGVFEDGSVGMGAWAAPPAGGWTEARANDQVPRDMRAMRQNLTSVVEDGIYNPWKRWWWGAAPAWATDQTYIHRTGLCLTVEGFLAYFWGESMGPEELGAAMTAARCRRGMHLDMNSKHTGLEFYRPRPAEAGPFQPLGRPLTDAEFEGRVGNIQSHQFRARKAVSTMTPLRFPRYLETDPRDFFYLTLRPVLPGPEVVGPVAPAGEPTSTPPGVVARFSTAGLPTAGWPHPFARARFSGASRPGAAEGQGQAASVWLVRIDPNRVRLSAPQAASPGDGGTNAIPRQPVAYVTGAPQLVEGQLCLHAVRRHGGARASVGRCGGRKRRVWLRGPPVADVPAASAAFGVDRSGFVVYAEVTDGQVAPGQLAAVLARVEVPRALTAPPGSRLVFHHDDPTIPDHHVDGTAARPSPREGRMAIWPRVAPMTRVLNPDLQPRPYRHWGWVQGQRVRYFPQGEPRFKRPGSDAEALTETHGNP